MKLINLIVLIYKNQIYIIIISESYYASSCWLRGIEVVFFLVLITKFTWLGVMLLTDGLKKLGNWFVIGFLKRNFFKRKLIYSTRVIMLVFLFIYLFFVLLTIWHELEVNKLVKWFMTEAFFFFCFEVMHNLKNVFWENLLITYMNWFCICFFNPLKRFDICLKNILWKKEGACCD